MCAERLGGEKIAKNNNKLPKKVQEKLYLHASAESRRTRENPRLIENEHRIFQMTSTRTDDRHHIILVQYVTLPRPNHCLYTPNSICLKCLTRETCMFRCICSDLLLFRLGTVNRRQRLCWGRGVNERLMNLVVYLSKGSSRYRGRKLSLAAYPFHCDLEDLNCQIRIS